MGLQFQPFASHDWTPKSAEHKARTHPLREDAGTIGKPSMSRAVLLAKVRERPSLPRARCAPTWIGSSARAT
jgi:hypothetical protein